MNKRGRLCAAVAVILAVASVSAFSACGQMGAGGMYDGYYTAELAEFDEYGWKEYVTIYVSNNKIVTVEYNAKNASGFVKSWDMGYMRSMDAASGTYPSKYARAYAAALLNRQNVNDVDVISGASHSHVLFQLLARAAINQSMSGDKQVSFVELPHPHE